MYCGKKKLIYFFVFRIMLNKLSVRERIMLLVLVALFLVVVIMVVGNQYVRNTNSVYTERVTEKQVYLENSQPIQTVKTVSNSMVTLVDESRRAEFLGLTEGVKWNCLQVEGLDCWLNGVVLTSDGVVAAVSMEKDLANHKFLAFDNIGHEYSTKLLTRDNSNGFLLLQLYRLGDSQVSASDRLPNYAFRPINFADLKNLSVGQQMLISRGNIFNGLASMKQSIISSLLRADQTYNWPITFSSEDALTSLSLSDSVGVSGNIITDLDGGLVGLSGGQSGIINIEQINYALGKYKKNKAATLVSSDFGVRLMHNSKQFAQNLGLSVDYGYLVSAVKPDGLAAKWGLHEKDVIVEIDGASMLYDNPWNVLGEKVTGDEVVVKVLRGKDAVGLKGKI